MTSNDHHKKIPAALLIPITLAAAYFPLLQWWGIFAPDLLSLPWNSPEWAVYWHVKDSLLYSLLFVLFCISARYAGYERPYLRFAFVLLEWWMLFAFIDLQLGGNWLTGTYWDWVDFCLFGAGALCAVLTEWKFRRIKSDPIEPGGVYVVMRPPRNWLEWAGSVVSWKYGPEAVYCRFDDHGAFLGPEKEKGTYEVKKVSNIQMKPQAGQIFRKVKIDSMKVLARFSFWIGYRWTPRRNCWKMVKSLTAKN